jgi:hypothetical protein
MRSLIQIADTELRFSPLIVWFTLFAALSAPELAYSQSAPTISSAQSFGERTLVTVGFSVTVDPLTATNIGNYFINNGVSIQNASLLDDNATVLLRTTTLAWGNTYTLTVNNVRDRSQPANVILPNSQRAFTFSYAPLPVTRVLGVTEPAGPSSRRAPFAISEIMYHPTNRPDGRNLEYIEIFNSNPWVEDLGGHRISGDADKLLLIWHSSPSARGATHPFSRLPASLRQGLRAHRASSAPAAWYTIPETAIDRAPE